jgi:hypothetical protein
MGSGGGVRGLPRNGHRRDVVDHAEHSTEEEGSHYATHVALKVAWLLCLDPDGVGCREIAPHSDLTSCEIQASRER